MVVIFIFELFLCHFFVSISEGYITGNQSWFDLEG